MVSIRAESDEANATCLIWSAERTRKRGTARSKSDAWDRSEAEAKTRRAGIAGKRARRTRKLRHRESTIILDPFQARRFEHDAVVIDSVASANYRLAFSERVIDQADTRAERLFVGAVVNVEDVSQPDARLTRLNGQAGARTMRAVVAEKVGIVFPTKSEIQSEIRADAPVVLRVAREVVVAKVRNRDG